MVFVQCISALNTIQCRLVSILNKCLYCILSSALIHHLMNDFGLLSRICWENIQSYNINQSYFKFSFCQISFQLTFHSCLPLTIFNFYLIIYEIKQIRLLEFFFFFFFFALFTLGLKDSTAPESTMHLLTSSIRQSLPFKISRMEPELQKNQSKKQLINKRQHQIL